VGVLRKGHAYRDCLGKWLGKKQIYQLADKLVLSRSLLERKMVIIGMKVYYRGLTTRIPGHTGMELYLRFALSQPMPNEKECLIRHVFPLARSLMYYMP
jgi:hypothetical protein